MKKLLSLTLAVLMLMTLMSCTPKKKTAYEIINDAQEKMADMDSIDISSDLNLKMGTMGITFDIPATFNIKASELTSDSPKAYIYIDMSYFGITISFELYYADEYLYLSAMGSNGKISTKELSDKEADEPNVAINSFMEEYNKLLKTSLEEVEVQENEDGSKTITYTIKGEQINPLISKLIAEFADEETAESAQATEIICSDIEVTTTINKDGYIEISDITCTVSTINDLGETGASLGMETTETSFSIEATTTVNNPGVPVEVTPINGYESFEEISPDEAFPEDLEILM